MSRFIIIMGICAIMLGAVGILFAIVVEEVLHLITAIVMIAGGVRYIYREVRDSSKNGEVSDISKQIEQIRKKLDNDE